MKTIREEIKEEMALCDREIRKSREEIIRLQERQNLFDDRKTMLYGFLQILDSEENEAEEQDEAQDSTNTSTHTKTYIVVDGPARCPREEGRSVHECKEELAGEE